MLRGSEEPVKGFPPTTTPLRGFHFPGKEKLKGKRVAGILYLCYRTRITIEFNFEFGFEKSNLMKTSFHGDAVIETL